MPQQLNWKDIDHKLNVGDIVIVLNCVAHASLQRRFEHPKSELEYGEECKPTITSQL